MCTVMISRLKYIVSEKYPRLICISINKGHDGTKYKNDTYKIKEGLIDDPYDDNNYFCKYNIQSKNENLYLFDNIVEERIEMVFDE